MIDAHLEKNWHGENAYAKSEVEGHDHHTTF
jgi:hypothetical protein